MKKIIALLAIILTVSATAQRTHEVKKYQLPSGKVIRQGTQIHFTDTELKNTDQVIDRILINNRFDKYNSLMIVFTYKGKEYIVAINVTIANGKVIIKE